VSRRTDPLLSIPVVLTDMAPMQLDMIWAIVADAGDIDCHHANGFDGLDEAIEATGADVIVTGAAALDLPPHHEGLLYRHPRLSVLAIRPDGSSALHRLRPHRRLIENISPADLLKTIREAAA
jgi:hypothetical protein